MSASTISAATIRAAGSAIPAEFRDTPQFVSDALSDLAGAPVVVKVETINPIRSFKGRGTWLAVTELVRTGAIAANRGVATISTGNFGQGIAYAARAHGVPAAVALPSTANPRKAAMIRRLGARIIEFQPGEDGEAALQAYADSSASVILRDGHDDRVAIGAATLAVEITEAIGNGRLPAIDAVWVPIGDGSLIAGVGVWLRSVSPTTRIIGVQVDGAPAMERSWRTGRVEVVPPDASRADGLISATGNADLLPVLRSVVDDVVLVREDALLAAQHELQTALGISAEASAAAGWVAARDGTGALPNGAGGARLAIVTGSNAWPGDFEGAAGA